MSQATEWNRRYVQFARANGRTPQEQFAFDRERGGSPMLEYVEWNGKRIREFRIERGLVKKGPWSEPILPQDEYDVWLAAWVDTNGKKG